jgi:leader peptidase (prepilin peptidase)/N-methyltransferase
MTGVLFLLCYYFFGIEWKLLFILVYVSLLIAITLIDLDHQIIPDGLLIFGAIFAIVEKVIQGLVLGNNLRILDSLYGMLVGGGVFLLIAVVSNGGMGGGDIKLMALLGFIFGFRPIVIIAMLAFIIGAVISVLLLVTKIKSRKDPVPFGPFIALSALLVIFLEERIVYWYITNMIL